MNYGNAVKNRSIHSTPQSKPIPGRENVMTKTLAGSYAFKADDWSVLRRWLLTGSMNGAFYESAEVSTSANLATLAGLINVDPSNVGSEIVSASRLGVNVHTPILALVYLSMGDDNAKRVFKEIFNQVIRTASHLYEFMMYARELRGMGSIIHKAITDWLDSKKVEELEYQFLKYQSRSDFSGRDILRLVKPRASDSLHSALYNWISGGSKKNPLLPVFPEELHKINAYEKLKKGCSEKEVIDTINALHFTWEMIPGTVEMTKGIWEALFVNMPIGATVRSLGNLTDKGIFKNTKNLDILEEKFSGDSLRRAMIHPINLSSAYKVYSAGGTLGKSKLRWEPLNRVMDILESGIERSFELVEPTGKNFFYALDVSGSMQRGDTGNLWLSPMEVEGILVLTCVKSEKNYHIGGFDTQFRELPFLKSTSYRQVLRKGSGSVWPRDFGGTDASVAYDYALRKNIDVDVFVFMTDNESWAGSRHPSQALKEYRSRKNKNAKAIYVSLTRTSDNISLVDPSDKLSYDFAGFTAETPKIINLIAAENF